MQSMINTASSKIYFWCYMIFAKYYGYGLFRQTIWTKFELFDTYLFWVNNQLFKIIQFQNYLHAIYFQSVLFICLLKMLQKTTTVMHQQPKSLSWKNTLWCTNIISHSNILSCYTIYVQTQKEELEKSCSLCLMVLLPA